MSEEQLRAFIAKVQSDPSLQEQLKSEGADPIAIAKAAGFEVTTEDLNSHRQNLTEDELEGVAGGGGTYGEGKYSKACTACNFLSNLIPFGD